MPARGVLVLYVSNQGSRTPKVDIHVRIDGKAVIAAPFDVGNQHNWVRYTFRLRQGRHVLKARGRGGAARLTRSFELGVRKWAVLEYWDYHDTGTVPEPRFTFRLSNRPIAFE
ncbi:MAG: hypothetical protein ABR583_01740 [Gaiellaceae bacterium]